MSRWTWAAALIAAVLACSAPAAAAPARNPELLARDYFGEPEAAEARRVLRVRRLTVDVDVRGGVARTWVTAEIANPGDHDVEADFALDLPAGSVVTGYALDVDGRMIEGVLEPPRKARMAYEAVVRRRVDPGLGEVTRDNAFRTRISPVSAGRGRTVRLTFVTPFDAAAPYRLPLNLPEAVDAASVVVRGSEEARLEGDLPLTFRRGEAGELRAETSGQRLTGVLELRPRGPAATLTLSRHAAGEVFFDLTDAAAPAAAEAAGRLRIYWDASRSRVDDRHAAEIALVRRYVSQARPTRIELVELSDRAPAVEVVAAGALAQRLGEINYRGATSYRGLAGPQAPADVCLLVSDGRPSLDAYAPRNLGCRLYAISSAKGADAGLLDAFARASGGARLDLAARGAGEALAQAIQGGPSVVAVTDGRGRAVPYALLAAPRGRFRLVGPAPDDGVLKVSLSDGATRTYRLDGEAERHDGPGALFGAARVADLAATDRPDTEAVLALSRRYRVASAQASFIVMEQMSDYAAAAVEPPDDFGKDALAEYRSLRAEIEAEDREARDQRLEKVLAGWTEQKAWWATRFDPKARPSADPNPPSRSGPAAAAAAPSALAPPPPPPPASPSVNALEEVVTTGARRAAEPEDAPAELVVTGQKAKDGAIQIEVQPWNPSRPYLAALKAAPAARFWAVYEAQAKRHGGLPAYYLDVAEMLFRGGRVEDARRVAAEAAEVPTADATTLITLADRLARYGDAERALWLHEKIAFLEPDRPQPFRNLALALVDQAERPQATRDERIAGYRRALDLLAKVVLTPWEGDYDGIELIALLEANRIVAKLEALGEAQTALDPRLVALLDVDLRVVMEWNTDATDMDLWVDEPNGERAFYSHPRTAIGGRMSDDMTGGYGPEEYLVRRAADGTYEVRVDVYATDQLNPNGATSVRATLFRNYGRPDEAREVLELDLKGEEDEALVGKIRVGR